jgi:hypothetical protein
MTPPISATTRIVAMSVNNRVSIGKTPEWSGLGARSFGAPDR